MKRKFSQLQDEPTIQLQLADDDPTAPPLIASSRLLCAGSSCAFGLPRDSSCTWDLSNLLIDGKPVTRQVAVSWLNALYMLLDDVPFAEAQPNAAVTATHLYQLLAFADAVGSSQGVLKACMPQPYNITFFFRNNGTERFLVPGKAYVWCHVTDPSDAWHLSCGDVKGYGECVTRAAGLQQKQAVTQKLVTQLEPLLYMAYRLQLGPLQQTLHGFIGDNAGSSTGILHGHMGQVLTQRVLQAAADTPLAQEALLKLQLWRSGSILYPPPAMSRGRALLTAVDGSTPLPVVQFKAVVTEPLPGASMGDVVDARLDLNACSLALDGIDYVIQLLVGPALTTPAALQAILGSEGPSSTGS